MIEWLTLVVFIAAFVAGAINSVAGGGTLLTFPSLIWVGLASTTANATSTVAIWPGTLECAVGLPPEPSRTAGRYLLADRAEHPRRTRRGRPFCDDAHVGIRSARSPPHPLRDARLHAAGTGAARHQDDREGACRFHGLADRRLLFQFLVALYGGYFGAGIGILMLAAFGIMGLTDIHQMNGLKTVLAGCINGIAVLYFVWNGMVSWPHALVMAAGAILGGIWGAGRRAESDQKGVRRIVVVVGFTMTVSLLLRL